MKAVVAAFNQEKALVGAFSVITNLRMELFEALLVMMLMVRCRRMEEELVASQQAAQDQETASLVSPLSPVSGVSARTKRNGGVAAGPGSPSAAGDSLVAEEETFTGISCLLITWKSNPEVEQLKVRYRFKIKI